MAFKESPHDEGKRLHKNSQKVVTRGALLTDFKLD